MLASISVQDRRWWHQRAFSFSAWCLSTWVNHEGNDGAFGLLSLGVGTSIRGCFM